MPPQFTTQSYSVRQAVNPSDAEVAKATTALCEAFGWQFFTDALDGDASLVPEILGAYLRAGVVGGEVYFAEHKAAGIVGVAIWFPPGTTALGTTACRGLEPAYGKAVREMRSWWTYFLDFVYNKFVENTLGLGVFRAAYHLQLIGVHPSYQRQGIAGTMMGLVEQKVGIVRFSGPPLSV
ncbi:hypothetical protein B0H13DRAFT_2309220 [Mycena leptocephala]|nr:hypothetical protein B0H13DRAFT_2309220 [Mycena leptocephala]